MSELPLAEAWHYRHDGLGLTGEIYRPQAIDNGNAVVVAHEADGIGGNVRRHALMLAELGYTVFAADLHGAGCPLEGEEIPRALQTFLDDRGLLRGRIGAAFDSARQDHGFESIRTAGIGYCFGGTAVLEHARGGAAVAAVASFHGLLTTNAPAEPGAITARVLACTGALDPLVPPADIAAFQDEMTAARTDWQLIVFGRAKHSFTNSAVDGLGDPRMAFDPIAEKSSWAALTEFLEASLTVPMIT